MYVNTKINEILVRGMGHLLIQRGHENQSTKLNAVPVTVRVCVHR
jgi:hypothetical protein